MEPRVNEFERGRAGGRVKESDGDDVCVREMEKGIKSLTGQGGRQSEEQGGPRVRASAARPRSCMCAEVSE